MTPSEERGRAGVVLTALGPDRPGLVNQLSSLVRKAGGNIEDTRMAKLGGEFAVLMFVTGSPESLLETMALREPVERELGVTCSVTLSRAAAPTGDALFYTLAVSGLDHPGIVETVTEVLLAHGINVASLASWVANAPLSGTPMFFLEAELQIPAAVPLSRLRRELGEACERENLDFALEPGRA